MATLIPQLTPISRTQRPEDFKIIYFFAKKIITHCHLRFNPPPHFAPGKLSQQENHRRSLFDGANVPYSPHQSLSTGQALLFFTTQPSCPPNRPLPLNDHLGLSQTPSLDPPPPPSCHPGLYRISPAGLHSVHIFLTATGLPALLGFFLQWEDSNPSPPPLAPYSIPACPRGVGMAGGRGAGKKNTPRKTQKMPFCSSPRGRVGFSHGLGGGEIGGWVRPKPLPWAKGPRERPQGGGDPKRLPTSPEGEGGHGSG